MPSTNSDYDVICVVSGIGGCAAAIAAAQLGEPVLLLEHMDGVCVDSAGRAEPHPAFHPERIDVRIDDANCATDDTCNVARIPPLAGAPTWFGGPMVNRLCGSWTEVAPDTAAPLRSPEGSSR